MPCKIFTTTTIVRPSSRIPTIPFQNKKRPDNGPAFFYFRRNGLDGLLPWWPLGGRLRIERSHGPRYVILRACNLPHQHHAAPLAHLLHHRERRNFIARPNFIRAIVLLPMRAAKRAGWHRNRFRSDLRVLRHFLLHLCPVFVARGHRHFHRTATWHLKNDLRELKILGHQHFSIRLLVTLAAGHHHLHPISFTGRGHFFADDAHLHLVAWPTFRCLLINGALPDNRFENIRDVRLAEKIHPAQLGGSSAGQAQTTRHGEQNELQSLHSSLLMDGSFSRAQPQGLYGEGRTH